MSAVNARLEELRKKMPRVKRIVLKVVFDLNTGEMTVQHSPKKKFDPELIIGMLVSSIQWLSADWYKQGLLKVPRIIEKKKEYIS